MVDNAVEWHTSYNHWTIPQNSFPSTTMPAVRRRSPPPSQVASSSKSSASELDLMYLDEVPPPSPLTGEKYREAYLKEAEDEADEPIEEGIKSPVDQRPPPLTLKDLEVLKALGKGQEGRVYLVRTKRRTHRYDRPNTLFALKAIPKDSLRNSMPIPDHMYNKDVEISKLASINWYPFIAGIIQVLYDPRNVYMMLEFVPCGTLRSLIQEKSPLPHREAAFYYSNIICGLEFLHAHRLVHRDVKPDNILVGQDGYLCLGDFGTAAHLTDVDISWTDIGTPYYSPPEVQFMDEAIVGTEEEKLDNRLTIDVYSAGCILYEMLTRDLPFVGGNAVSTWNKKFADTIKWPEAPNQTFGKHLKALILSSLNRLPDKRPTIGEIKQSFWLKRIDWEQMISRRCIPPCTPEPTLVKDSWHKEPMPAKGEVPGISIVEPALHLAHDNRFPEALF